MKKNITISTRKILKALLLIFFAIMLVIGVLKLKNFNRKPSSSFLSNHHLAAHLLFIEKENCLKMRYKLLVASKYRVFYNRDRIIKKYTQYFCILGAKHGILKKTIVFKENLFFLKITSNMIKSFFCNPKGRHIVDLGLSDGIRKGNAITQCNKLIGSIVSLNLRSSELQSIKDKNSKISVSILDSGDSAIAVGQNNERYLKLLHLRRNMKIKENQIIVTSGNGSMPYGIYIGITRIVKNKIFIDVDIMDISN